MAVGDQVVLAQTGELVDIAVKRLVVSSAPRGAGAAGVVVTWGGGSKQQRNVAHLF